MQTTTPPPRRCSFKDITVPYEKLGTDWIHVLTTKQKIYLFTSSWNFPFLKTGK